MDDLGLIKRALSGELKAYQRLRPTEEWAFFGFYLGFRIFNMIRSKRLDIVSLILEEKGDGSPATDLEKEAEAFARRALSQFYPDAGFQGEETGVSGIHQPFQLIIDPIDGTRSFLSGFDTYCLTLGILRDRKSVFSLICNPSTGDFAYRIEGKRSRIFQFPSTTQEISLVDLPYLPAEKESPFLVNIHPSRSALPFLEKAYNLWNDRQIALVKSVSGSPSLQILETARGGIIYFNAWFEGQTMPYDLIVPLDILKGANGRILDQDGNDIDPWSHRGFFLAGIQQEKLEWLIRMLKTI